MVWEVVEVFQTVWKSELVASSAADKVFALLVWPKVWQEPVDLAQLVNPLVLVAGLGMAALMDLCTDAVER